MTRWINGQGVGLTVGRSRIRLQAVPLSRNDCWQVAYTTQWILNELCMPRQIQSPWILLVITDGSSSLHHHCSYLHSLLRSFILGLRLASLTYPSHHNLSSPARYWQFDISRFHSAQQLDLFVKCVRLTRLTVCLHLQSPHIILCHIICLLQDKQYNLVLANSQKQYFCSQEGNRRHGEIQMYTWLTFTFSFSFGVDYVQRWGRPSTAAQCATPT